MEWDDVMDHFETLHATYDYWYNNKWSQIKH
jgi:hypothetical protein